MDNSRLQRRCHCAMFHEWPSSAGRPEQRFIVTSTKLRQGTEHYGNRDCHAMGAEPNRDAAD